MMFVQPAKTAEEQNIVVYQHRGAIYFATTKVSLCLDYGFVGIEL